MAYTDYVFVPKATDDDTVTGQVIMMYGIAPGGYWINEQQGRFLVRHYLNKQTNAKMKCCLYKDYTWSGDLRYSFAFAVERINGESGKNIDIWSIDQDENGYPSDAGTVTYSFGVYDANTLVSSFTFYGDAYFNDPDIPIYDTRELAFAAMADQIWKEKTKYQDGGYTEDGGGGEGSTWGGGGLFDHSSDPIDFTPLPVDFATNTRLFRLYLPTEQQLKDFADFLYSNAFDISTLKKLFADPMDYILGLAVFPLTISGTTIGAHNIYIGNIDTGVNAVYCNKQFIDFDCGSLLVKPFWDAYLDYAPYTKISIFLPFIGFKELDTDDIIGKTLQIRYMIDIITGACMAQIKVGDSVRYSFVGQCSANVPLSGTDWTQSIQGAISIAGQVGGMATTGAVSASGISSIASTAVNMIKPNVQRSGGFSGSGAFMGYKTPYLVITRPVQALPENQANIKGYPSYRYVNLGRCEEFTAIDSWIPEGFNCSQNELQEIDRLLKEGVYL